MENLYWEVQVYNIPEDKNVVDKTFEKSYANAYCEYNECLEKYDLDDHIVVFSTKLRGK